MKPNSKKHSYTPAPDPRVKHILTRFWGHLNHNFLGAVVGGVTVLAFQAIWHSITTPSTAPIEDLISMEAKLAAHHTQQDLGRYRALFAHNAQIRDVSANKEWTGQDNIVDRVRPLSFSSLVHTTAQILIPRDEQSAFARTQTTFRQLTPEVKSGGGAELWQFIRSDGRWKILSLSYGVGY